jgi:hypothetical protein
MLPKPLTNAPVPEGKDRFAGKRFLRGRYMSLLPRRTLIQSTTRLSRAGRRRSYAWREPGVNRGITVRQLGSAEDGRRRLYGINSPPRFAVPMALATLCQ